MVKEADCKGSYLNFYIGNEVVLVPIYGDEHDKLGLQIIEGQFPGEELSVYMLTNCMHTVV